MGPDQKKKKISQFFFGGGLPSDLKKFQLPLFAMKIMGQPRGKSGKLNFHWKICGNFSKAPLQGSKILRAPFLHQAPLTSVCEQSIMTQFCLV